jgi:uncharacterized membrane protein HdeD (DUF308 family)
MSDIGLTRTAAQELNWAWGLTLVLGVLSVVVGVIVVVRPGDSLGTLAVITGIFVLLDGIFELAAALRADTGSRGLAAMLGVISVIVGVMLVRHPIAGVTAVALILGIWLIAAGVVRFVLAFEALDHRLWRIAVAVIEAIAGIVIVANPNIGFATLALLAGLSFIANGIGLVLLAWAMHAVRDAVVPPTRPAGVATG